MRQFRTQLHIIRNFTLHIHLILRNRPDVVETWSDREVVRRNLIINRIKREFGGDYQEPTEAEINIHLADAEKVAIYRRRLSDISAFMAALDEYVAVRANCEDSVTGHFWESRFDCRNLEDETAILVCGIYVDLNQIRAGEATTPEESSHTSAFNRICGARDRDPLCETVTSTSIPEGQTQPATGALGASPSTMPSDGWLCELTLNEGPKADVNADLSSSTPWRLTDKGILPIGLDAYLSLLDWTGRQHVSGKSSAIPAHLAPILERLHIRPSRWLETIEQFETLFGRAIGRAENLARRVATSGRHWIRGASNCAQAFT